MREDFPEVLQGWQLWDGQVVPADLQQQSSDPTQITDRSCYEVNIFDQRTDPTYGTGGIVNPRRGEPDPQGRRQMEHLRNHRQGTADHRDLSTTFSRPSPTTACSPKGRSRCNTGAGVIKFRKVAVKAL